MTTSVKQPTKYSSRLADHFRASEEVETSFILLQMNITGIMQGMEGIMEMGLEYHNTGRRRRLLPAGRSMGW